MYCSLYLLIGVIASTFYLVSSDGPDASPSPLDGPYVAAISYSWVQNIEPTIIGTVIVTVDEAANQIQSSTIYHSEYESDNSLMILTRTDTNNAGTVTQVITDMYGVEMTITYPINYFEAAEEMTWFAELPVTTPGTYTVFAKGGLSFYSGPVNTLGPDGTCCLSSFILSPTPTHPPFMQTGIADAADLRGWLYTLIGISSGLADELLNPEIVSSLWTDQPLNIAYTGCSYTACDFPYSDADPYISYATSQAYIFATSTTTISSVLKAASQSSEYIPQTGPPALVSSYFPRITSSPSPVMPSTSPIEPLLSPETPVPSPETPVPSPETPVPSPETPVPLPETPQVSPETPIIPLETLSPSQETPISLETPPLSPTESLLSSKTSPLPSLGLVLPASISESGRQRSIQPKIAILIIGLFNILAF